MNKENITTNKLDRIIFGCGRLSSGGLDKKKSIQLLNQAYELGIKRFDIAPCYGDGNVESLLVEAFGSRIEDILITSKVGLPRQISSPFKSTIKSYIRPVAKTAMPWFKKTYNQRQNESSVGNMDAEFLRCSFEETLEKLGVESIDTLLLHEPRAETITPEVIEFLDELVKDRKINRYGTGTGQKIDFAINLGQIMQFMYSDEVNKLELPYETEIRLHGFFRTYESNTNETDTYNKIVKLLNKDKKLSIIYSTRSVQRLKDFVLKINTNKII